MFFVTSRTDEAHDKGRAIHADVSHARCTVLNWQLSMGQDVQAIDLITIPRTWTYFRLQPGAEWVGCVRTEDGSTCSSPASQPSPHLEVHFLDPSLERMYAIDMR